MNRRRFLELSTMSLAALASGCASQPRPASARGGKRILVLGGTNFLGPAIVETALAAGHEVTLFNRGITRPYLFPGVERLRGERAPGGGDLRALNTGRRWDAVIDVWPEQSELVADTARLLASRVDYYFFCSSIAVYRNFSQPGLNEESAVHDNDPGWYGGEKALAERVVAEAFPGAFGTSRCHAILGPRDDGTAYHYWLRRIAQEDAVLAPGSGNDPVQYTDVRDVAAWVVDCVERRRIGIHNLCGPQPPMRFRTFLEGTRAALGSDAQLVWVDADFLRESQGVHSFSDLPLWAPLDEDAGFYQVDGSKAGAAGARFRPLAETARDAWRWYSSHYFRHTEFPAGGLGLARERELAVLAAWRARPSA